MFKTPVSILLEFSVKNNCVPVFTCIEDRLTGSNDHQFTTRVTYLQLSAIGVGSTKKEAKQNAADAMLILLNVKNTPEYFQNNILKTPLNNSLESIESSSSSENGFNYIGLLHEYSTRKRINFPTFTEVNSWGPDHKPKFIVRCKIGDLEEEGTALTKKLARTEAAKKVWLKLPQNLNNHTAIQKLHETNDNYGLPITCIEIQDVLPNYKKENRIAEQNYLKLTKLTVTPLLGDKVNFENCHRVFTSEKYTTSMRERILGLLKEINTETENPSLIERNMVFLNEIARLLNSRLTPLNFQLRRGISTEMSNVNYITGYKLNTNPEIIAVGYGKTLALSQLKAIACIVNSTRILFI